MREIGKETAMTSLDTMNDEYWDSVEDCIQETSEENTVESEHEIGTQSEVPTSPQSSPTPTIREESRALPGPAERAKLVVQTPRRSERCKIS